MNGAQNGQMGGSWHATCSTADRQKVVNILAGQLQELMPQTYNDLKARTEADNFEKMMFQRSSSRDEYMSYIRRKINLFRERPRTNDLSQMPMQGNVNAGGRAAGQDNFYQRDRAQSGQMRSQATAGNAPAQASISQQQQIANIIRQGPIPAQLLAKIPMLPANVTTWPQVQECIANKVFPQSAIHAIKEVQNAHIQLVLRQHQQKANQMRKMASEPQLSSGAFPNNTNTSMNMNMNMNMSNSGMNSGNMANNNNSGNMPSNMSNMNNMSNMSNMSNMNNMSNMSNMSSMSNNNMGMGNMSAMTGSGASGNMGMGNSSGNSNYQNSGMNMSSMNSMNSMGNMGNMNMTPQMGSSATNGINNTSLQSSMMQQNYMALNNSQNRNQGQGQNQQQLVAARNGSMLTREEVAKYHREALLHLQRMQQNGQLQNLDQQKKLEFIRKYILQAKMKDQNALAQGNSQQVQQNRAQPQQNMNMMGNFANQQGQHQRQAAQSATGNLHAASQLQNMLGVPQAAPMLNHNMRGGKMNQSMGQSSKPPQSFGSNGQTQPRAPAGLGGTPMQSFLPQLTDEMKQRLQTIGAEVSQKQVPLKDVTMLLSDQEKATVRELMGQLASQYQNVDHILTYFYVLSGNAEGTKRLMQLKLMTKTIYENLRQDVYLAGPELVDRIRGQYQKFSDYVREQIALRKEQQESLKLQQLQQQQQPQPPQQQNQGPGQGMHGNTVNGLNAGAGQFMQNNQQFSNPGMPQLMPGNYSGQQVGVAQQNNSQYVQKPVSQLQQQQQQQYARNIQNQAMPPQKNLPSNVPNPRIGSSPITIPSGASPVNAKQPYKASTAKKGGNATAANRRKNAKPSSAMPTPVSAPTPATLANAIKTPNTMPTPLLPQTQSNKGTPNESSPTNDLKIAGLDKEPLVGDVFGKNSTDFHVIKRRELLNTDPEQFFFSALSNLLDLDGENKHGDDAHGPLKLPLLPKHSGEWTADIKPFALVSAFRQVDSIKDLTSADILADCAELVKLETVKTEPAIKRELDEDEDLELLFVDKKFRAAELAFDDSTISLVEYDDWKSWLTKLQET